MYATLSHSGLTHCYQRFSLFEQQQKNFPPLERAKMAGNFVQYKNFSSASFHLS